MKTEIQKYLDKIQLPSDTSHKGENGKILLIGGSQLFHAASKWSLDTASKIVDMVFYSSVPDNNEAIKIAKTDFWNGIVVPRGEVENYIEEANVVLIGPGMERNTETKEIVDRLVEKYSDKKWVIDAGALQMINPTLLKKNHIITPHEKEMSRLTQSFVDHDLDISDLKSTVVLKGKIDKVSFVENNKREEIEIEGGNPGMTKGGTGDVLAGLIAALYCTHDAQTSAVVGSYINKKAGDELYKTVGPYFNTSNLVETVPKVLWQELAN